MSARSIRRPADIAEDINNGNKVAEGELVERYSKPLLFIAKRATGDQATAEELCQETLLRAIVRLRAVPLEEPEKLAAYLRGIATGLVRNAQRKASRQKTYCNASFVQEAVDEGASTPSLAARQELSAAVRGAISSLPVARDQQILARYYLREEESSRVCEDLGLAHCQFKSVLYRARKRLKRLLIQRGIDSPI